MNQTIADSIIIRVGKGIMTIPRKQQKQQSADEANSGNPEQKNVN